MTKRWRPKNEGVGPFSKLNINSATIGMSHSLDGLRQQLFLPGFEVTNENRRIARICICPGENECVCENPEPKDGVALVSNLCHIHNFPDPDPYCPIHGDDNVDFDDLDE